MKLTIGGKEYELRFGILFNNLLDNFYTQTVDGMEFGMGVEMAYTYLSNENPGAVFNVIKAATGHLNQKPSNDDIEAFIAEQSTADKGLDKFCKELINEMTDSPFLKSKLQKIEKEQKKAMRAMKRN